MKKDQEREIMASTIDSLQDHLYELQELHRTQKLEESARTREMQMQYEQFTTKIAFLDDQLQREKRDNSQRLSDKDR